MGTSMSRTGSLRLDSKETRRLAGKEGFRLIPVIMTKEEADSHLSDSIYTSGTYILYEDFRREKMLLALKDSSGDITHHPITQMNGLYYFHDFPFPYLEAIILYYKKYKFQDIRFTQQAFIKPRLGDRPRSVTRCRSVSILPADEKHKRIKERKEEKNTRLLTTHL